MPLSECVSLLLGEMILNVLNGLLRRLNYGCLLFHRFFRHLAELCKFTASLFRFGLHGLGSRLHRFFLPYSLLLGQCCEVRANIR